MGSQRAAELQALLEGIELPAEREQLIAYVRQYDADAGTQLAHIPKRSYGSIDEVGEELWRTQPVVKQGKPLPAPETWPART